MLVSSQADRDRLRNAILEYLAPRFRFAYTSEELARHIQQRRLVDFEVDAEDVDQALVILLSKGWIKQVREEVGATVYAQVTGEGILAYERASGLRIRP